MVDIFDQLQQTEPEVPSLAKRKEAAAKALKDHTYQSLVAFINSLNLGFDYVWNNPDKLTPQQVCDGLGVEAASIFKRHGATIQFLMTNVPQAAGLLKVPSADYAITYEVVDGVETGRVLITEAK